MVKRKKKKLITKNTHVKRKSKSSGLKPMSLYEKIAIWVIIAFGILTIILRALDNHIIGYDNFIGIPSEWVRSCLISYV